MSGDFDPRVLWTRRQVAIAMGAAAAVSASGLNAAASDAEIAGRGGPAPLMIAGADIDGDAARRLAHLAGARLVRLQPEIDPVRFWAARVAPGLTRGAAVIGVTSWADYLLLRGLGAENRLRVRFETGADARPGGVADALSARLVDALAATEDAAGGDRIAWIMS